MSLEMDLMLPFLLRRTAAVSNVHISVTSLNRVQFDRHAMSQVHTHTHTHTHLTALFPGLPGWAGTRKVKPIWILLKQETVSGSGMTSAGLYASLHLAADR